MKKSVEFTTTVATIGLATVLALSAVAPSQAATTHKSAASGSTSVKSAKGVKSHKSGSGTKTAKDNRQFTSVNFTVNNVPSSITDANTAAQLLVAKVVPLAADATSAPDTAPLPTAPAASNGAPSFGGGKAHHGHGKGDKLCRALTIAGDQLGQLDHHFV